MKINLFCPECSAGKEGVSFVETIRDDGLYDCKCPEGHSVLIATQTLRYEMLFEIALNAVDDGYFREAISSFAASAERFYEFAIRVLARSCKLPDDLLPKTWKNVTASSERQFGAYLFLYCCLCKEAPPVISQGMVTLRNDVVHKGYLPSRVQTHEFGAAIYDLIQSGVGTLRDRYMQYVNEELTANVDRISQKMGDRYPRSFQVTPTGLNVISDSNPETFEELLVSRLRKKKFD